MTGSDLEQFFEGAHMDETAKAVFLAMNRNDQLLAMLGMLSWNRSETARLSKEVIEIKSDIKQIKREGRSNDKTLTTSEKINLSLEKRFRFWVPILQYVLSTVTVIVILWLLRGAFGVNVIP